MKRVWGDNKDGIQVSAILRDQLLPVWLVGRWWEPGIDEHFCGFKRHRLRWFAQSHDASGGLRLQHLANVMARHAPCTNQCHSDGRSHNAPITLKGAGLSQRDGIAIC